MSPAWKDYTADFFTLYLNIEQYEGDSFEDTDKNPFEVSTNYLSLARELEYEGQYGTADYILKILAQTNGNIGKTKKISF